MTVFQKKDLIIMSIFVNFLKFEKENLAVKINKELKLLTLKRMTN